MKTRAEIERFVLSHVDLKVEEVECLVGEIVTRDSYRFDQLQTWTPPPEQILDLGANVGIFTLAARCAFPEVPILAVEPNRKAMDLWEKFAGDLPGVRALQCGLGHGVLNFISTGGSLGTQRYGKPRGEVDYDVVGLRLSDLPIDWGKNVLIKLDAEGGEDAIRGHWPSEACLTKAWAIVGELHWGHRFDCTSAEEWSAWFTSTLISTHDIIVCRNTHPTREPNTGSGNIDIFARRRDVHTGESA